MYDNGKLIDRNMVVGREYIMEGVNKLAKKVTPQEKEDTHDSEEYVYEPFEIEDDTYPEKLHKVLSKPLEQPLSKEEMAIIRLHDKIIVERILEAIDT